jgi:Cu-Zn family superoxide dismutase
MKRMTLVMLFSLALPALAAQGPKHPVDIKQEPPPASTAAPAAAPAQAKADLKDAKGKSAGSVTLLETPEGVKLKITATGLDSGKHGIHVHEIGKCAPPDFKSAGAHFNPTGKKHGAQNPSGPHAGDLPNLVASADGMASGDMTLHGTTLASLMDADGSAIVIHAKEDDEKTDPSGNSGDRVACGVVTAQ